MKAVKTILGVWAILLVSYNLLWTALQYYVGFQPYRNIGKWAGLLLLLLFFVYLTASVCKKTISRDSISRFLKDNLSYEQAFLLFWLIWFVAGCFLRQFHSGERYFASNDKHLFITALVCLVIFPLSSYLGPTKTERVLKRILQVFALVCAVYSAWAVWQYMHLNFVTFPSGKQLVMTSSMGLSMGCNRNYTGAYGTALLGVCLYLFFTMDSAARFLYIPAGIIQAAVVCLTNSRASFIGALAMLMAAAFMASWTGFSKKGMFLRITAGVLVALIIGALFILMRRELLRCYSEISAFAETAGTDSVVREGTDLSGRGKIWAAAIKGMFSSPTRIIFGVTPVKVTNVFAESGSLKRKFVQAHNVFLQIGLSYGLPVLLGFMGFLLSILKRCLRILFSGREYLISNAWTAPVVILGLIINDMAESFTACREEIGTPVFFLFCGLIVMLDRYSRERTRRQISG